MTDRFDKAMSEIARPVSAPDQTTAIMRRLGYVHASREAARSRRRRRLARRTMMSAAGLLIAVAAFGVYRQSDAVRRPDGPTIPGALQSDFARQQSQFQRAIRNIRNLSPRPARPVAPPALDETFDRSAVGPGKWI